MTKKAILVGSLDTKGEEFRFVKEVIERSGVGTIVIDTGILSNPLFTPDIEASQVAEAGGMSIERLRELNDRGKAVETMTNGIAKIVAELTQQGVVGGVFGMGGTAGTTVGAAAMQAVPIGIPKMLVSTVASGNTRPYVGIKDISMMYSVVDIAGINALSRRILSNAAYAIAGMIKGVESEIEVVENKTTIGLTMFGVTTPCVTAVREILELQGYELLVFHATGTGGMAMEELIRSGYIQAVADITTTELADELVGGIFSAGPDRVTAAGAIGIPQIVSVGALDMVNFGPVDSVPTKFKDRKFYQHNPTTTLMRTTVKENEELGRILADKLNRAKSPTVVIFPKGGVSLLDRAEQAFEGINERDALYQSLKSNLRADISFIEMEQDINDPAISKLIAHQLLQLLGNE